MLGRHLRRALGCNLYSYAQFRDWYGETESFRCWFEAQVDVSEDTEAYVEQLFWRGIIVGFGGSLLEDGEYAFVVSPRGWNENDYLALRKIDYWHGVVTDQPVCQMHEDETNYAADELISPCHGLQRSVSHICKNGGGSGLSRASYFRATPGCIYLPH